MLGAGAFSQHSRTPGPGEAGAYSRSQVRWRGWDPRCVSTPQHCLSSELPVRSHAWQRRKRKRLLSTEQEGSRLEAGGKSPRARTVKTASSFQ